MNGELLPNQCIVHFVCDGSLPNRPCAYRKGDNCWYDDCLVCKSSIACVNAMVLELKKMGVDFILTGRLDEIKAKLKDAVRTSGLQPVEEVLEILEEN